MLTSIGDVLRESYSRGWITTRDGNISLRRRDNDTLYITPSGVRKNIIHPDHILRLKFTKEGELLLPEDSKPSGELEMHRLLQMENTATRAVVHLHPTNTIAAMFAGWDLQGLATLFPELNRYTRVGPTVPVVPVTSAILAEKTFVSMTDPMGNRIYDIVGQAGHGVTAVGLEPWTAFEHVERLEHVCGIVLASGVRPPVTE